MFNEIFLKCVNLRSNFGHARFYVWILAVAVQFLIIGCKSDNSRSLNSTARVSPFYLGVDISGLTQVEKGGGIYRDGDKTGDPLAIFMKNGWTCFRLRIWVDPRDGINGLDYTTKLAKRIKEAGGTFMLDFHYSDWWADPQKQPIPAAWRNLNFDALVQQVGEYTSNVVH